MKWGRNRSFKWFFALLPHSCRRCDNYFWLEKAIKHTNRYGETIRYCKECALYEWFGAKVGRKEDSHE